MMYLFGMSILPGLGLHNVQFFYHHRDVNLHNKHIAKRCDSALRFFSLLKKSGGYN